MMVMNMKNVRILKILSVLDPAFQNYGQVLTGYDCKALLETLEAVKPYVENNQYVGLACAMKNAGVGVGIPDTGRCRLVVEDGRLHIFAGASCIGQGLGTVLTLSLIHI